MGVPAFFRWLSRKYPSVIIECVEERQFNTDDGQTVPQDTSKPNPNGIEFDNLYLDMNGIIHPCTHPEDKPAPKNEDEMMVAIFECIDRLFTIVRPRKVLYMAIDGVAPRAKMNQQRSRRFRASKEAEEKAAKVKSLRQELLAKGFKLPPEKPKESHFDSNCITPGTPFMERLSKCLHYYIHDRLNNDPGWRKIKVILSDANVPGEGEHKIMDFIRRQRAQPDHDPNTQHVLCGADADLIMLGLATHEANFTIIREEFKPNKPKPCDLCGQLGHEMQECVGIPDGMEEASEKVFEEVKFIFVRLNVLREYLERELAMPNLPFEYNFDRAIDDWVFMCFFVGNDFLPHLPSLEIRENAIDRLVRLYKDCCYKTGGWLTDSGTADMSRVQMIMQNLGKVEDEIFRDRQRRELDFRARNKMKRRQEKIEKEAANMFRDVSGQGALGVMRAGEVSVASGAKGMIMQQRLTNMDAKGRGQKRSIDQVDSDSDEETPDEVRLYEEGAKDRYYESKFEVSPDNHVFRKKVANEYARGLCWVLKYYYQGCVSWDWYFPFHYAPFASDFSNCATANITFDLGEPFNPLEQLMGVFPAASRAHVPEPWGKLMYDPESVIIDFYPEDFKIDLNGKKFAWQGVALLPFVDETRLKNALKSVYHKLTPEEKLRNKRGDGFLYVSVQHQSYKQLTDLYRMGMSFDTEVPIAGEDFQGMQGTVLMATNVVKPTGTLPSPVIGLEELTNNHVVTVRYRDPKYSDDFVFPARRLEGAKEPPRVLKPEDYHGGNRNYRPVIGFNQNMPRASLGMSGHRTLGHHLPNLQGGGLLSNNVLLLQGGQGGQGLLGACPTQEGLLGAAPGQGSFLGSGLGGQGTILGSGIGQNSLLGKRPGGPGDLPRVEGGGGGGGPFSLPRIGPEDNNSSERSGPGRGALLGSGPRRQGLLGDGPSQQNMPKTMCGEGCHQEKGLLGSAPQQEEVNGRGHNVGLLGSGPWEGKSEHWPQTPHGMQYQNDNISARGFPQRSLGSAPWQGSPPHTSIDKESCQGMGSSQDSCFGTERKQGGGLLGLSPVMSHHMNQRGGGGGGGGQYSNVPPPMGRGGNGKRSLLGAPPQSSGQSLLGAPPNQYSSYQGNQNRNQYGGGQGGYGGYNSNRNYGGGYNSNQRQNYNSGGNNNNQGYFTSGGNNYNSRGGYNSGGNRSGGGGGGYGGNYHRGRGRGGYYRGNGNNY
ncbi:5'-3' exoribonuclease 2 homolog [Penaeus vannamei]|uniref:5'-3' exoribonuclease 2 homolog n=1 Tax=Penaeus vannamei TaxID=6689 RepID=UPI00387F6770